MHRIEEAGDMGWVLDIEMRLLKAIVHISDNGLPIDSEKWAQYIESVENEIRNLSLEMDSYVKEPLPEDFTERNEKNKNGVPRERIDKVNWRSSDQVGWAFELNDITLPKPPRVA